MQIKPGSLLLARIQESNILSCRGTTPGPQGATDICYTWTTFGFPRVTQKPSIIVKENVAKHNITFNVRQVTNDLKRVPFRFPFYDLCGALAPEDPSTAPK